MATAIIVIVVVLLLLSAFRLWLTANRLDRLHVRTEAAWAVCGQALARRIVAARALATAAPLEGQQADVIRAAADLADRVDTADSAGRQEAEQALTRSLADIDRVHLGPLAAELADANERITFAQQFYNDAVRDTRALRASWFTRLFRLAGHARLPGYFDADAVPGDVTE